MIFTGSSKDIEEILKEKKEEVAQAVKKAREAMSTLTNFCYDPKENKYVSIMGLPEEPMRSRLLGKDYLFDMLRAYIEAGPDIESRMREFSDNMQRPYSEVKKVLDFLGLEVQSEISRD